VKDEDLRRRTAAERERHLAWKELGYGLLDWRLARVGPQQTEIPNEELALAHRSAYEICRLALACLRSAADEAERTILRDTFSMTVRTLDMYGTPETLAWLKAFDEQVGDDEVAMKYEILNALLGFPSERLSALKRMIVLDLPPDLRYSRDYALLSYLWEPDPIPYCLTPDEQGELAKYLREHPFQFGTKKAEKMIKSALKNF
jgi:hypothetical protein